MNRTTDLIVPALCIALGAGALVAQTDETKTTATAQQKDQETAPAQKLSWPKDAGRRVCSVAGRDFTLRDLLTHIAERHYPGMLKLMDTPAGLGYLQSPKVAEWVRAFADVKSLEIEAAARELDFEKVREQLGEPLKQDFEAWMKTYQDQRAQQGSPLELTQERVNLLLTDYQRDEGLRTEVQGWLDVLVPETPLDAGGKIREFYEDHPQYFGGVVTLAQIFVETRDPRTLELKTGKDREASLAKLADIRARLLADGSNFEEVARLMSDDHRTAREGGRLDGVKRFDQRLPAAICRTAWNLKDGQISDPFESPYGVHIVKRIGYRHLYYVVFGDRIKADVAATMRRIAQEDLLFDLRRRFGTTLWY
ncbi:MAG: peptidylprolyl isomerase [Planctomycetota bacterium]